MKNVLAIAGAGICSLSLGAIKIDDFNSGNFRLDVLHPSSYAISNPTTTSSIAPVRYINVSAQEGDSVVAEVTDGKLFLEAGPQSTGSRVKLIYSEGIASWFPQSGRGDIPFSFSNFFPITPTQSASGVFFLRVKVVASDVSSANPIRVYATNRAPEDAPFSIFEPTIQGTIYGNGTLDIPIRLGSRDQFTLPYLSLSFEMPAGTDIAIDDISMVPEPASMLILGAGVAALAARRRKA